MNNRPPLYTLPLYTPDGSSDIKWNQSSYFTNYLINHGPGYIWKCKECGYITPILKSIYDDKDKAKNRAKDYILSHHPEHPPIFTVDN